MQTVPRNIAKHGANHGNLVEKTNVFNNKTNKQLLLCFLAVWHRARNDIESTGAYSLFFMGKPFFVIVQLTLFTILLGRDVCSE